MKGFEAPSQRAEALSQPERFRYEQAQKNPSDTERRVAEDLAMVDPKTMSDQAGEVELIEEARGEQGDLVLTESDVDDLVDRLPQEDTLFDEADADKALDALQELPHDALEHRLYEVPPEASDTYTIPRPNPEQARRKAIRQEREARSAQREEDAKKVKHLANLVLNTIDAQDKKTPPPIAGDSWNSSQKEAA